MNISSKLTEQKLEEILINIYKIGQERENIKVIDFIEEIKKQVILVINVE